MRGTGLPPQLRLRTARDYRAVFSEAIRSVDACFTVLARANTLGRPRLGLAMSKKCVRRAVDRSRLKRIARESFRVARADLPAVDIVVLARTPATRSDNQRLFASLAGHWKRIRDQLCASC